MTDLIITHARVLAPEPLAADSIAISGGVIAAIGTASEIAAHRHAGTHVIDAQGGSVLPGFVESHMHLFTGAAELSHLPLTGIAGAAALTEAIRDYAATEGPRPLLCGQGVAYGVLGEGIRVDRHVLDRILPEQPFVMFSYDHHTAWANTAALQATGLLHGAVVPPGNEIVMAEDGMASGELREPGAFNPVMALDASATRARLGLSTGGEPSPAASEAERAYDRDVLRRGLAHCARHGITSIQNMDGNRYTLELLDGLRAAGDLTCRVRVPFHFVPDMSLNDLEAAEDMRSRWSDDWLSSGMVKLFMDGVLESWTAAMEDDYADRPGWRGELRFEPLRFAEIATAIDRRGLQIAVHAIGDRAVRIVLDGYAAARAANGVRDSRHRVEHLEVVRLDDLARFRDLGVIASMQPPHPPGLGGLPLLPTLARIGAANEHRSYAWRAVRDAGVRLVFASDWPVSAIDVIASMHAAMTRPLWREGLPDNRQSLAEALAGYTADGAFASFAETRCGRLAKGMLADLVVLSGDIAAVDPAALPRLRPVVTIAGGRVTFAA